MFAIPKQSRRQAESAKVMAVNVKMCVFLCMFVVKRKDIVAVFYSKMAKKKAVLCRAGYVKIHVDSASVLRLTSGTVGRRSFVFSRQYSMMCGTSINSVFPIIQWKVPVVCRIC